MTLYQIVNYVHPLVCVSVNSLEQPVISICVYMLLSLLWVWCLMLKLPLFSWWRFLHSQCLSAQHNISERLAAATQSYLHPKWSAAVRTVYWSLSVHSAAWSGEFWLLAVFCYMHVCFVLLCEVVTVCTIQELTYFMILYYTILGFGFVTFDSSLPVEKTANIHYHQINGKTV